MPLLRRILQVYGGLMLCADDVIRTLENNRWHFAKSMPRIPHFYTRKQEWEYQELYTKIAAFIAEHGKPEKFFRKTYTYLYSKTHKYWIMANDPRDSEVINRAERT